MPTNLTPLRGRASGAVVLMGMCVLSSARVLEGGLRAVDAVFRLQQSGGNTVGRRLNVGLWIDERVTGSVAGGHVYWITANVSLSNNLVRARLIHSRSLLIRRNTMSGTRPCGTLALSTWSVICCR
jgi:hypothetical protein